MPGSHKEARENVERRLVVFDKEKAETGNIASGFLAIAHRRSGG
jgi:hypothetical protein